jgi:RNA polymerase sigma-70 factor (ECF subfamily)
MDAAQRQHVESVEADIRVLCDRGDHTGAATLAIRCYGPELFGFLVAMHRNEADAGESFSEVTELMWRNLPRFAWRSTLRTWAYTIARNVLGSRWRSARRRAHRFVGDSALEALSYRVRTETQAYLRTEKKTRLQALRDTLPEEDRLILVLRVDRGLEWVELARVLREDHGGRQVSEVSLEREAVRLRKRFQLVKAKLRALAKREGLVD